MSKIEVDEAWVEEEIRLFESDVAECSKHGQSNLAEYSTNIAALLRFALIVAPVLRGGNVVSSSADPESMPVVLLDKSEVDAALAKCPIKKGTDET